MSNTALQKIIDADSLSEPFTADQERMFKHCLTLTKATATLAGRTLIIRPESHQSFLRLLQAHGLGNCDKAMIIGAMFENREFYVQFAH